MSTSLKHRWFTDTEAATSSPFARARAKVSSAPSVESWSTRKRAPVCSTSARSRSSWMRSAMAGAEASPRRVASSPEVATAPSLSHGSAGRQAIRALKAAA